MNVMNHMGQCVADLERSRTFYEEALGFEFWRQPEKGPRRQRRLGVPALGQQPARTGERTQKRPDRVGL